MARKIKSYEAQLERNRRKLDNIVGNSQDKINFYHGEKEDLHKALNEKKIVYDDFEAGMNYYYGKIRELVEKKDNAYKKYTTKESGKDAREFLERQFKEAKNNKKVPVKKQKIKVQRNPVMPIEERLNNYKNNRPIKVGPKVEPTLRTLDLNYSVDGAGTRVNSRGKLGVGRKAGNNIKSRTKAGVGTGVEASNAIEVIANTGFDANKTIAIDTHTLDSKMINGATKTKSFAYQKNELFKKIVSGSHGDSDFNKIIDSLEAVKTGQEEKVGKYLEARAKRPHNAKKPVAGATEVRTKKPVLDIDFINKSIEKPAAAAPKAGKQKHIYTVFDFETNGKIKGNGVDKVMPEVLSYSAQKYELDLLTGESVLKGSMEGYYQPKDGNFNGGAQRVHGLNEEKINAARTDKNYGATFEDDKAKLIEFMNKDSDAIVAHNLSEFDGNYFVGELDEKIIKVDTYTEAKKAMLETDVLQYSERKNGDIHTKTNSSVYHYYENKMPEGELHNAANDVKITAENYHNMVLDEKTGLADNLGLDKTKVKEFKRAKSDHYYRITVGKDGEKITTKMSAKTNQPLTVDGEIAEALKRKENTMSGVTAKEIAENAKTTTRKFGDTMREFGTATKKFGDDFSKLSTGKKAGRIAGVTAVIGGGALLVKTAKDRRKAEQEKLKSITASVEKNRSGGF